MINEASSTLRIAIPGSKLDNTDSIIDEVNKRTANVLGVRISVDFTAAEEFSKTIQSAISSEQQLDLVMDSTGISFNQMVSAGKYAELDELLNKYGKNILKARSDEIWNYNKINGKIMGITMAVKYDKKYGE